MKTIYVDMDGVLCDFHSRWTRMFGNTPKEAREQKESRFSTQWNTFIDSRQFSLLDRMPNADKLIDYLKSVALLKNYRVAILSSSGGFDRHNSVILSKRIWLERNMIDWPYVFVPGRRFKAGYAEKRSLLIDDTPDVIEGFNAAGGKGVLHVDADVDKTIATINEWMGV